MRRVFPSWLVVIVGASFVARTAVGWLRPTPVLFPDEYMYSALGRSVADSGRPLIRGGSAHFPALLQPLVTAPAWLVGDVGTAFRLVQASEALAMSLAAIPVYLLASQLGLSRRVCLVLAALAVLVPDVVYSSFISSEAFAYPLVLAAVCAATRALARPSRRAQLAFVAFAVLAALTRVQLAVLPVAFALVVLVVGARERRLRAAAREQMLPLALFLLPVPVFLAVGAGRALGYYHGVLGLHPEPFAFLRWTGSDAMALAYASGWILVPGALLGLWLAIARPLSRAELAFGAMAVVLALLLLTQAGFFQSNPDALHGAASTVNGIKERYFFYVVPLGGIAFALYARRGWPARLWHLVLAAALVCVSVRVPLSGFASPTTVSASPVLYGLSWLGDAMGSTGSASLAVAATVTLLSVLAVVGSRRPQLGTPLALAATLAATAAASAGAVAYTNDVAASAKHAYLPADPSFVDHSGLRHTALLQSAGGLRNAAFQTLFWNRTIDRVLLLPQAQPFDTFAAERVRIAGDGALLVGGETVREPLLVDGYGATVRLRGARPVATGPGSTLWAPTPDNPRLSLYATGRYFDGWLAARGRVYLWPEHSGGRVAGLLSVTLRAPMDLATRVDLQFRTRGGRVTNVRLAPGEQRTAAIPVCAAGPTSVGFSSNRSDFVGLRLVSVRASAPLFIPDDAACPVIVTPVGHQTGTFESARGFSGLG